MFGCSVVVFLGWLKILNPKESSPECYFPPAIAFGQPCRVQDVCAANLKCIGSVKSMTCQCWDELANQDILGYCRLPINHACQSNSTFSPCSLLAECVNYGEDLKCKCKEGYIEVKHLVETKCEVKYGQKCQTAECDSLADLVCMDNICQCRDPMSIYSSKKRKCLSLIEGKCKNNNACVPNSKCKMSEDSSFEIIGKCECKDGWFKNATSKLCYQ